MTLASLNTVFLQYFSPIKKLPSYYYSRLRCLYTILQYNNSQLTYFLSHKNTIFKNPQNDNLKTNNARQATSLSSSFTPKTN